MLCNSAQRYFQPRLLKRDPPRQEKFKAPEMDIDAILDMQDDMAEILEESNEINEVLGQDYGIGEQMDEDELLGGAPG